MQIFKSIYKVFIHLKCASCASCGWVVYENFFCIKYQIFIGIYHNHICWKFHSNWPSVASATASNENKFYSTVNHQKFPFSDPTHPPLWWRNTWMLPKLVSLFLYSLSKKNLIRLKIRENGAFVVSELVVGSGEQDIKSCK